MKNTIELIATSQEDTRAGGQNVLQVANDVDPHSLNLAGVTRVELNFPKFSDGRAFSQAYLLRRRLGFTGDLRATGDVLVDQVVQMQRCGFSSALLRADQSLASAQAQLQRFSQFYQGDAAQPQPLFAQVANPLTPAPSPSEVMPSIQGTGQGAHA